MFTIVMKFVFIVKVRFEFGQYMVGVVEGYWFFKRPYGGVGVFLCLFVPL
jgi:hypothetical protein